MRTYATKPDALPPQPTSADSPDALSARTLGNVPIGVLFTWLVIQLAALGVALARVQLWASVPRPADVIAINVVLSCQVIAVGLLFPRLCCNWRTMSVVVLSAFPLIELAGFVSQTATFQMLAASLALAGWITALWLATPWVARHRTRVMRAVAVSGLLSIGGPVLVYVQLESQLGLSFDWHRAAWFGPTMAVLQTANDPRPADSAVAVIGMTILVGAALRVVDWVTHRSQKVAGPTAHHTGIV